MRRPFACLLSGALMVIAPAAWADSPCEVATTLITQAAAARQFEVDVTCQLPPGAQTVSGRWMANGGLPSLVSGPARVSLQAAGSMPRTLAVPIVLTVKSTAWLTRRAVAAGQVIGPQDLVRQMAFSWPVGVLPSAGPTEPPVGRARQYLRAGEVLSLREVAALDELMRGDVVTLSLRTGAMTVEQPAVLVADARIGQMARVQIKGRREVVEAWITDPTTVVLSH